MALDNETLAAAKSYTKKTVLGGGAIKGKNCTIDSIVDIEGGHRITFKWILDDGTVQTDYIDVLDGTSCQLPTLPEASAGAEGMIAQYIGDTTASLTNGCFYKCVENDRVYSWEAINVQAGGGGFTPIINVVYGEDGDAVRIVSGSTSYTGVIAGGHCEISVSDFGTYEVYVNNSLIQTIAVDTVKIYLADGTVSRTLTVVSAVGDTVVIKNTDGDIVDSIVFDSNASVASKKVLFIPNKIYTFVSSIAVSPSDVDDYYSEEVTLTDADQRITLHPDGHIIYWAGINNDFTSVITYSGGTVSFNTNNIRVQVGSGQGKALQTLENIDLAPYTKLKVIIDAEPYASQLMAAFIGFSTSAWTAWDNGNFAKTVGRRFNPTSKTGLQYAEIPLSEVDISSASIIYVRDGAQGAQGGYADIYALWLE